MKRLNYNWYFVLCTFVLALVSCKPNAPKPEDVIFSSDEDELAAILKKENARHDSLYRIYNINEFMEEFMTEEGNFLSDTTPYRSRSTCDNKIYLYAVDTIKTDTIGIYIRGRVCTDDYAGNFYKAMVIQQITDWNTGEEIDQQCLRISVDMGSVNGQYPMGQEILIRCNGLSIGRYANQPQLCVPAYNNNIYAVNNTEKVGWGPGRIPASRFRKATKMIGAPDRDKLKYDSYLLKDLFNESKPNGVPRKFDYNNASLDEKKAFMKKIREADGRLVTIRRVCFTGYTTNSSPKTKLYEKCIYHDPNPPYKDDSASLTNVFAPTTNNLNYPQSRVLCDFSDRPFNPASGSQLTLCCSCSEYSKFANFFFPGAMPDFKNAVAYCQMFKGTVTGILGWYCDNATRDDKGLQYLTGLEWSVTPRGIPGVGVADIDMKYEDGTVIWEPTEFDPKEYQEKLKNK